VAISSILVRLAISASIAAEIIGSISYRYLKTRYDITDIYIGIDQYLKHARKNLSIPLDSERI